ncbi:MAG: nucleotidyltransferase domain-containing protein [Bacteroidota bacterium]|nr:nucleotidyltransferase domain-containing protein [Bacteroidota bacterium]
MVAIVENKIPEIVDLCKKHKLKSLYLFGSATDAKYFNKKSDVDFLYEYDKKKIKELDYADNYFDFLFSLKKILKRNVDLMPNEKLKNPYLLKQINSDKIRIYG